MNTAILFALDREARPFLRRHRAERIAGAPCAMHRFRRKNKTICVLVTGVGFEAATSAIVWLLAHHEPKLVVAAGFAGALDPTLQIGDIVLGAEVVEEDGETWRTALPVELGDRTCGRMLTARTIIGTVAEKRRLHRATRAIAVDMESAAIAEACQGARIPCAVVRVISDEADTALSKHLAGLVRDGRPTLGRVLMTILRRPTIGGELWRLARDTRIAAERLADAIEALVREPDEPARE